MNCDNANKILAGRGFGTMTPEAAQTYLNTHQNLDPNVYRALYAIARLRCYERMNPKVEQRRQAEEKKRRLGRG